MTTANQLPRVDARAHRVWWATIPAAFILLGLWLPLPNHYQARWVGRLLDASHIPCFAFLTVCAFKVFQLRWRAIVVVGAVVVIAEWTQQFSGRSSSGTDVLRGLAGIALGTLIVVGTTADAGRRKRILCTVSGAAIASWSVVDCLPTSVDAYHAWRSFPVLADFTTRWQEKRWRKSDSRVYRIVNQDSPDGWVGVLEKDRGTDFGLTLFPVIGNWSGYERLHVVFSFRGEAARILVSVRDGVVVPPPAKRFDQVRLVPPGRHDWVIDLQELAAGGPFAPVDTARVQSLHFQVLECPAKQRFLIHRVYLE